MLCRCMAIKLRKIRGQVLQLHSRSLGGRNELRDITLVIFRNTHLILLKWLVEQAAAILIPISTIKVPRGL